MLRSNLSSRPFYNERLVSLALGIIAAIAVGLTVFNAYTLYHLSAQRSQLKAEIAVDKGKTAEVNRAAVDLQRSVDRQTLVRLAGSTQEANSLIDSRTFSWTEFFGFIEKTMPMDLRLIGVAPRIEKGEIRVIMNIVAKRSDDIETFVDALQQTGAFSAVYPKVIERDDEDGSLRSDIISVYVPPKGTPAPGKPPAAGKAAGRRQP
jgi:hypothetical protein